MLMKRRYIPVTTDFGGLEGYRTRPSLTHPKLGEAKLRNVGSNMRNEGFIGETRRKLLVLRELGALCGLLLRFELVGFHVVAKNARKTKKANRDQHSQG